MEDEKKVDKKPVAKKAAPKVAEVKSIAPEKPPERTITIDDDLAGKIGFKNGGTMVAYRKAMNRILNIDPSLYVAARAAMTAQNLSFTVDEVKSAEV